MKPVRNLPAGWESEIEKILGSLGEDLNEVPAGQAPANGGLNGFRVSKNSDNYSQVKAVAQALKLGFRLAVKERDSIIKQFESLSAQLYSDTLRKRAGSGNYEQVDHICQTSCSPNGFSSYRNYGSWLGHRRLESSIEEEPFREEVLVEPVEEVAGYGFGIAISGGVDNPHFTTGETSIVVSDIVQGGPADGLLLINDRILSANNSSLVNACYATAVDIMKDSDHLNLVIKRRVPLVPSLEFEQRRLKFTLTKSKGKEDFGLVLGCKFFIRHIKNPKLADKEPGLRENDMVLKINGQSCDDLSLSDASKLLDKSRERLSLVVQRDIPKGSSWRWPSQTTLYERVGSVMTTPRESPRCSPQPMNAHPYSDIDISPYTPRTSARSPFVVAGSSRNSTISQSSTRSRTPNKLSGDLDFIGSQANRPLSPTGDRNIRQSVTPTNCLPGGETNVGSCSTGFEKKPGQTPSNVRNVSFCKEGGSVGIRVIGGNSVGIFVSEVQQTSPAAKTGIKPGDKILKVNGATMDGVTREDAVLRLLGLTDQVDLVLLNQPDDFQHVRSLHLGDNFFIRANFTNDSPGQTEELRFSRGNVFQVTDTLYGGTVGFWQANRISDGSAGSPESIAAESRGVIPNLQRAEKLAAAQHTKCAFADLEQQRTTSSTLKRKKLGIGRLQRSKSMNKGSNSHDVEFPAETPNVPAYERVRLQHPGFLRPVVLFGPLADVAQELLVKNNPLLFACAPLDEVPMSTSSFSMSSDKTAGDSCYMVKQSSIKEIMSKNKHCILDVTPHSVEKLAQSQFCPIVICIHVDNKTRLKELRARHAKDVHLPSINSAKVLEQAAELQKMHGSLFTATLDATKEERWFERLCELISQHQPRKLWLTSDYESNANTSQSPPSSPTALKPNADEGEPSGFPTEVRWRENPAMSSSVTESTSGIRGPGWYPNGSPAVRVHNRAEYVDVHNTRPLSERAASHQNFPVNGRYMDIPQIRTDSRAGDSRIEGYTVSPSSVQRTYDYFNNRVGVPATNGSNGRGHYSSLMHRSRNQSPSLRPVTVFPTSSPYATRNSHYAQVHNPYVQHTSPYTYYTEEPKPKTGTVSLATRHVVRPPNSEKHGATPSTQSRLLQINSGESDRYGQGSNRRRVPPVVAPKPLSPAPFPPADDLDAASNAEAGLGTL